LNHIINNSVTHCRIAVKFGACALWVDLWRLWNYCILWAGADPRN